MIKAKLEGMKSQTSQRIYFGTVADIAYYRVAKRLHVYTNLVLPSGFKLQLYQRKAISSFDSAVMCYRKFTTIIYRRRADIQFTVGKP